MSERSTKFEKGQSGNPAGRPKGSRSKATLALEAILDGEAEAITRKAIEMALDGDPQALRMCMDRLLPPRKDRPALFDLPPIKTAADLAEATGAMLQAVATGEMTPSEAAEISKLVTAHVEAIKMTDLVARLEAIEGGMHP
jgi:hypothetical protein